MSSFVSTEGPMKKTEATPLLEKDKSLGDKTITTFGSYVLTINNLSGPYV